jgi:U3 small nucleolar RNA-associated protein 18
MDETDVVEASGGWEFVATEDTEHSERKPVWEDEHDATAFVDVTRQNRLKKLRTTADEAVIPAAEYAARLRAQHVKLNPGTAWAELPWQRKKRRRETGDDGGLGFGLEEGDEEEEFEEESTHEHRSLLLEQSDLVVKSKGRLPQGLLEVSRMKDANIAEPSNAVIQSVEFHRNGQLLLTAGFDHKLRFFQVFLVCVLVLFTVLSCIGEFCIAHCPHSNLCSLFC